MSIILGILFLLLGFAFYMQFRNMWVYRRQCEIGYKNAHKYLSYEGMLFKFWVWDVEKLKK